MAKLEELDLADGVANGRAIPQPTDRPSCESRFAPGLTKCQYCGARVNTGDDHPLGHI